MTVLIITTTTIVKPFSTRGWTDHSSVGCFGGHVDIDNNEKVINLKSIIKGKTIKQAAIKINRKFNLKFKIDVATL